MITCTPVAFFSWKFDVEGAAEPAALAINFLGESGTITYGSVQYEVTKQGWLSGAWNLEGNGQTRAQAQKGLLRQFEVLENGAAFELKAQLMSRCYDILQDGREIGSIRPEGIFTRRAVIDCSAVMPEETQLFCFWLAALTWRRDSESNAASS